MRSIHPNHDIIVARLIACLLPGITGCGIGGSQPIPSSEARVVNAIVGVSYPGTSKNPDAINVATSLSSEPTGVNGTLSVTDIPFGGASTYMPAYSGVTTVSVLPTGGGTALMPGRQITVSANTAQTLMVVGVVGGTQTPQVIPLTDTFPTLASGQAGLRVVNLSPDSPPLDLYSGTMPIVGLTNISYPNSSNYVPVTSAPTLMVYNSVAGVPVASKTLALGVNLTAGHAYTAFIIGMMNPLNGKQEPFDVRIVLDN